MVHLGREHVVLQVLPRLDSGGVERGTIEIVQAIAGAGGTPLVASAGGRLGASVQRAGGRHITLPLSTKNPLHILQNARVLAGLVRSEGVRVIHARSRAPAWSALLAARRTRTPFVTTYHGIYNENFPGKVTYNGVMAAGDVVIATSLFIKELLLKRHKVDPGRLRVIPRGIDPLLFDPERVTVPRLVKLAEAWRLPDGAPTVMLPARLSRWKGHAVLIAAMARLQHPGACCVMVGDLTGRERFAGELERQARQAGVADRLRLVGHCDDMPAALMLADVVVSASTDPEGFGRAVIEAQAMARPVIATNHGGAAETVQHEVTGWRVPPGDVAALAAALDHALSMSPGDRHALGVRARAAVLERYTTAAMQDATLDVYRELLG